MTTRVKRGITCKSATYASRLRVSCFHEITFCYLSYTNCQLVTDVTICRFQYCQFARSSAVCCVSSLLVVDVQYRNPVYSSQTGSAVQQKLVMRQFSGHHISRLGNKNQPSSRELVRHRFSAIWLRSSGWVFCSLFFKASPKYPPGGTALPFPP